MGATSLCTRARTCSVNSESDRVHLLPQGYSNSGSFKGYPPINQQATNLWINMQRLSQMSRISDVSNMAPSNHDFL